MTPTESELVARFWDRIRLFAARRVQDTAMAEDIAQETLRRVVEALRSGRLLNPEALPGFVFQTAKHVCMHALRSAGREARAMRRLHDRPSSAEESADVLALLVREEQKVVVHKALLTLSTDDQALLRALYFDQVDAADLAATLGLSAGALRVRKHRALRRLAEAVGASHLPETPSTQRELIK